MKLLQKVSLYSLVASSSLLLWPVSKVQAHCKVWHPHHCSLPDIDPTRGIPGSKDFAENAWGEAGAVAYPAAASIMRGRHGSSQGLDSFQKRNLKPHFGDLVGQVVVIYNASMMDRWSALGKSINLSGVDTAAQTYCDRIYVRDPYKPNDLQQLELLAHELVHSRQCQSLGGAGKFGFHYFREFKRAGLGYDGNKLEKEADSFSKQIASSFSSSLAVAQGVGRSWSHAPNGDFSKSHPNEIIEYITWDSTKWTARIVGNTFLHAPNGDFSKSHPDEIIEYITWDGTKWTARIVGNTFLHAPNGDFSKSHPDEIIEYITWDGTKWTAKLL
jgi:hypothetical protein